MPQPKRIKSYNYHLNRVYRAIEYSISPLQNPNLLEAPFYSAWNLVLTELVSDHESTLTVAPQWWLTRRVLSRNADKRRVCIPDFVILRPTGDRSNTNKFLWEMQHQRAILVAEIKSPDYEGSENPLSGIVFGEGDEMEVDDDDDDDIGRDVVQEQPMDIVEVIEADKLIADEEKVEATQTQRSGGDSWWKEDDVYGRRFLFERRLLEAQLQAKQQVKHAFLNNETTTVIALACAAYRWTYTIYNKNEVSGLSAHEDETYRDDREEVQDAYVKGKVYELGTKESDIALREIKRLIEIGQNDGLFWGN